MAWSPDRYEQLFLAALTPAVSVIGAPGIEASEIVARCLAIADEAEAALENRLNTGVTPAPTKREGYDELTA